MAGKLNNFASPLEELNGINVHAYVQTHKEVRFLFVCHKGSSYLWAEQRIRSGEIRRPKTCAGCSYLRTGQLNV